MTLCENCQHAPVACTPAEDNCPVGCTCNDGLCSG
jgi:hypothetical protein